MESAESSFWIAWLQGGGRLEVNLGDWAISGDAIGSARQTDRHTGRQTGSLSKQAQRNPLPYLYSGQFNSLSCHPIWALNRIYSAPNQKLMSYTSIGRCYYNAQDIELWLINVCSIVWFIPAGQSVKWDVYGLGWHIIWAILRLSNSNMVLFSPLLAALFPYIRYFVRA